MSTLRPTLTRFSTSFYAFIKENDFLSQYVFFLRCVSDCCVISQVRRVGGGGRPRPAGQLDSFPASIAQQQQLLLAFSYVDTLFIYSYTLSFFLSFFLDVIPPSQEKARDQTASQQRRLYCCVPGNLEKWASMSSRKKEEKEKKAKGKKRERRDGYRRWWEIQATIPLRTSKRRKEIKRALAPVNCLLVEAGPSPLPVMRVSKHFI